MQWHPLTSGLSGSKERERGRTTTSYIGFSTATLLPPPAWKRREEKGKKIEYKWTANTPGEGRDGEGRIHLGRRAGEKEALDETNAGEGGERIGEEKQKPTE